MRKLVVHDAVREIPRLAATTAEGREVPLSEFAGRVAVLNFWATWCAPCVKEMPALDRLQEAFDPDEVRVIAVATGRNPPEEVDAFLEERDIDALAILYDPKTRLASALGVLGLPVTLLLDRDGREVARLSGEAEWDGESARRIVSMIADWD